MNQKFQQTGEAPVRIFYSYSHNDEILRNNLEKHLSLLQKQGLIDGWHDTLIRAGDNWESVINDHLEKADIVLLLISADFLASKYCYGVEASIALERAQRGECRVIPIILRPCDWQHEARLAKLQCLPSKKSVTEYQSQDIAFQEIAEGIRKVVQNFHVLPATTFSPNKDIRQRLINRVREDWIEGVLNNSLYRKALLSLGLQKQPDAVTQPWRMIKQELDKPVKTLPYGTKILSTFDEADGQLLLLGEPGAGKTTLLLELAQDLLQRAEKSSSLPIPTIFNLSSWGQKRQTLSKWMIEELQDKYDVPQKSAQALVINGQIVPLLDGFDEIAENRRINCITAINVYLKVYSSTSIVICSRNEEYYAQKRYLALRSAISILPLNAEQIDQYLAKAGNQLKPLREAIKSDESLSMLITTPLWLSIFTLTYQGVEIGNLLDAPLEKRRSIIFDRYIERMLTRNAKSNWESKDIKHWLAWLAKQMKEHYLTEFSLEDVKPDWFEEYPSVKRAYDTGEYLGGAGMAVTNTMGLTLGTAIAAGVIGGSLGIFSGPVGWLIGGGIGVTVSQRVNSLIQQKSVKGAIKLLIWSAGVGPQNYTEFLNYAVSHILLRKVGKSYMFVHQLLLDHCASSYTSTTLKK